MGLPLQTRPKKERVRKRRTINPSLHRYMGRPFAEHTEQVPPTSRDFSAGDAALPATKGGPRFLETPTQVYEPAGEKTVKQLDVADNDLKQSREAQPNQELLRGLLKASFAKRARFASKR